MSLSTITITFGEVAENQVGMQKLGEMSNQGLNFEELAAIEKQANIGGLKTELIKLNDYLPEVFQRDEANSDTLKECASILIIRRGISWLLGKEEGADQLLHEQSLLLPDKQYYDIRRLRVLNKLARYNLCFADFDQVADYSNKKGTVVSFARLPVLAECRTALGTIIGEKATNLNAEGNYYYDVRKCGIGFHGDAERKKVIALRLGASMCLHYQWFQYSKPIGQRVELVLDHGDLYIMSEKATGHDWNARRKLTLRHAAGAKRFLTISQKIARE